jgi:hypothetical protein
VELGGLAANIYGALQVTGAATIAGELEVTTEGFTPAMGNAFQVLTSSNVTGTFALTPAGFATSYNMPSPGDVTIVAQ